MIPIEILLVEDNEGDILLTTDALMERKIVNKINVAKDGKAAIHFLDECISVEKKELPDLILLDINLPKKNGHEVLQYIKGHEVLKQIPVIMLTTSSSEKDILQSYKHHANCYITKPVEVNDFLSAITGIEDFWVSLVKLPSKV